MDKTKKVSNLLWTGGWDSTFQLLRILLIYKSKVQLFYMIDPKRKSSIYEINAMKTIKELLIRDYPYTKELMLPIKFTLVSDILPDNEIETAYLNIKKDKHIGTQYGWLARFCKENKIYNMQLSVEKSIVPDPKLWDSKLVKLLIEATDHEQKTYKIDPEYKDTDEFTIFRYFSFPLIETTKIDMLNISKERKWKGIMDTTWFCFFPTKKGELCGICKPCVVAITEGFSYRFSSRRRLTSFYYRKFEWPLKGFIKSILISIGLISKKK